MNNSTLEIGKAYKYCQSVTKTHAKSFYFAAKFLPKHKQKAVFPIYAFCRHVDDEIDEVGEGGENRAIETVEKWRQKLEEVFEGKGQATKDERQDLVFLAWQDFLKT